MTSTATTKKPPYVPKELLEWLKERFKDTCPSLNDSDRQVWVSVGSVEVVRHLQALYNKQENP